MIKKSFWFLFCAGLAAAIAGCSHFGGKGNATRTAPDELMFTRKAPGGLIAIELVALVNWLESANFPLNGFELPALPKTNSLQP